MNQSLPDIVIRPIGVVRSQRTEVRDDDWGSVQATIELDSSQFGEDVVAGLEGFSHLEVLYHFHLVPKDKIETAARHPRNRTDWPRVGIFAQRGKGRPNRLGISRCRLEKVEGLRLYVEGLDAVDGSPVVDIKPYMAEFAPIGAVRQPEWATELMARYF